MDLSKLHVPETAVIHIKHPTEGPLYSDDARKKPCTITVFGPSSDQAVAVQREATKWASQRMGKNGLKGLVNVPAEELEERAVQRLAKLTAAVDGIEYEGKKVTPETVEQLYHDKRLGWLREQVMEKVGSWEDFLA